MNHKYRLLGMAIMTLFLFGGCAAKAPTTQSSASNESVSPKTDEPLSIELTYLRGHTLHQFVLSKSETTHKIQSFSDRKQIKEIPVEETKFSQLSKDVLAVVKTLQQRPSDKKTGPCRTPFNVRIIRHEDMQTLEGCRTSEEGISLGKLLREIEFIMSSSETLSLDRETVEKHSDQR